MASIRQDVSSDALPDFRNLGVIARVLIGVNAVLLAAVIYAQPGPEAAFDAFLRAATLLEPLLVASVAVLYFAAPALARLPYLAGGAVVVALELALAAGVHGLGLRGGGEPAWLRVLGFTAALTLCLLAYFRLFTRAWSPALSEARLMALQSRIRPHFLFNSLNAVLSLIRQDPRRAELALQDLADLFRVLMSDGRSFVRLAEEIDTLERYAGLEQLRLGERLRVIWELDSAPQDALLPPLILQPLLENAIYHGVEPGTGVGEVVVQIAQDGDRVRTRISNPVVSEQPERRGNRMALENIRERLLLFFDAEARIEARVTDGRYEVTLEMPYRLAAPTRAVP
ncbi:MAG: sensor histidine kinase [Betaproteobacteria bacterium]|nr:sensor histidine kinase [Betaproteobacteria bacterium]